MAQQLLGKEVTAALNDKVRERAEKLKKNGVVPTLAVIRLGEDGSDISYEKGILKRSEMLGVKCVRILLPRDVSQEALLEEIYRLNEDDTVHGVLLFRPLPKHLDAKVIENALVPSKDIDCMTEGSLTGVFTGREVGFPPCTPQACIEVLDHYGIDCTGKRAVVVGRSLIVGKPLAMMLLKKNATVTICHTKTKDLPGVTREADILLTSAGHPDVIRGEHVRSGQIVIDVGINMREDGKLCGDVNFEEVEPVVDALTPVPGGVGSVTTSVLISHVVTAAEKTLQ